MLRRDLVKQDPGIFSIAVRQTPARQRLPTRDTDVAANTRYAYRVEAINAEGNSGRSNYVNVKTSAAPSVVNSISVKSLPAKPSGLELSVALDNSVTFEWDDPGDSSITHYKVLRRVGDSGKFSTIEENTGSADTSYTDTTVSAETTYEYRVVAVNGGGDSPESDSLSVETSAEPRIIFVEIPVDDPIAEEQSVESLGSITIGTRRSGKGGPSNLQPNATVTRWRWKPTSSTSSTSAGVTEPRVGSISDNSGSSTARATPCRTTART